VAIKTNSNHILLVSREPLSLKSVWDASEANSWQVDPVRSGLEALERVETGQPASVILLDLSADDHDGLPTLRWLRRVGPHIPVVVLSQSDNDPQVMDAMRLGAEDYVVKPCQRGDLERVLRRHVAPPAAEHSLDAGAGAIESIGDNFYFVAASPATQRLRARASLLAQVAVPVLITGESGSGRETAARLIHKLSIRSEFPFAKIDCSLLPAEVLERELWGEGRERDGEGVRQLPGKFDLCRKGSILLDEVDSLPDHLQSKLLNLFQSKQVFRNGNEASANGDVRVMASTSVDAQVLAAAGRLREDLWHWLSTFVLHVPSLRERRDEIPLLPEHFMSRLAKRYGLPARRLSPELCDACRRYSWPGNLREMENFVRRYLVMGDESVAQSELQGGPVVQAASAPRQRVEVDRLVVHNGGNGDKQGLKSLLRTVKGEAERTAISRALDETHWNRKAAARQLNISYRALLYKIQQHQMTPPKTQSSEFVDDQVPKRNGHGQ